MRSTGLMLTLLALGALLLVSCEKSDSPTGPQIINPGESALDPGASGSPQTTDEVYQFPITEFTSAQGSFIWVEMGWPYGFTFFWSGPAPDYPYAAWVDYAGVADAWLMTNGVDLGTEISGNVTEQILNSGERRVQIVLHATNALTLVNEDPHDPLIIQWPTIMGANGEEVLGGAIPALSNAHFQLTFRDAYEIGDPLPDLVDIFMLGEPWEGLAFDFWRVQTNGTGPLHEGSGWPEGTGGHLVVSQTCPISPGTGFAWIVEVLKITANGP